MKTYTLSQSEVKLIFNAMETLEYILEDHAVPPQGWTEARYNRSYISVFDKFEKLANSVLPVDLSQDECEVIRQALYLLAKQPDANGFVCAKSDEEAQAALELRNKFE